MTTPRAAGTRPALGLYALKPWYARRLGGPRRALAARGVRPDTLTWTGVAAGAAAGAALGTLPAGVLAGLVVSALLALRLACANLDGALARDTGACTPRGAVVNELGDRLAELAALAGLLLLAPDVPPALVAAAAFAATLPSWVALAGAASGAPRLQGGPVGKTERCALLALAAFTGWWVPLLSVLAAGSALTALARLARLLRLMRTVRVVRTVRHVRTVRLVSADDGVRGGAPGGAPGGAR